MSSTADRRPAGFSPTWAAVTASTTAWVVLLAVHGRSGGGGHGGGHAVPGPPGAGRGGGSSLPPPAGEADALLDLASRLGPDLAHWALMCVAMMLPVALPAVQHVVAGSLRRRRLRAAALFVAAYLSVWTAAGLVALPVVSLLQVVAPTAVLVVALLVAVPAWQLTRAQVRARAACHRTVPLPPLGRRADAGCLRFGVVHGSACVAVCGPLVGLMALSMQAHPLWMVPLTALGTALRLAPRRFRPPGLVGRLHTVRARRRAARATGDLTYLSA